MNRTAALVMIGPEQVELSDVAIPEPAAAEVVVRAAFSVISPGTELRCLAGRQANARFPFVAGYSTAGTIEWAGPDSGRRQGQRVFCKGGGRFVDHRTQWGGHAGRLVLDGTDVLPLPDALDLKAAAVTKIAAIAYHGFRLADPHPADRCIVLGLGMIGQISARLFAGACPTIATDLDASRIARARNAGVEAVLIDRELQPLATSHDDAADLLVDSTGVAAVMRPAMALLRARPWGDVTQRPPKYLVQGSYPGPITIDYPQAFMKEAQFVLARDTGRADLEAVLGALASGRLVVDDLLERVVSPADAASVYAELATRGQAMTAVFDWSAL